MFVRLGATMGGKLSQRAMQPGGGDYFVLGQMAWNELQQTYLNEDNKQQAH